MRDPDARRDRLRAAGPWVLDGLLALAAAAAGIALLSTALPFDPGPPWAWAAYLLVLAHTLPIAVRRRFPLPALAWGLATGVAFAALGLNLVTLTFAILVYVYTAAASCPRRVSVAGLAATEAVLAVIFLARPRSIGDASTLVLDGLVVAAAWWLGDGTRRRQEAVAAARQRAAELEQAREELARRAVTEERLRIARELHDVVAHSMSIIAVQSTARVAVRYAPGQVAVEVIDDGRGGDPGDHGHGIPGMRERAALYGGTLEAGPLPGGGFRVATVLPLEEAS